MPQRSYSLWGNFFMNDTLHYLITIEPPADMLRIPCPPQHMNETEMELNNLYAYIVWLRNRIDQLEKQLDSTIGIQNAMRDKLNV